MKEIISFLAAGSFVYLALGLQSSYGNIWYYIAVIVALIGGYLIR